MRLDGAVDDLGCVTGRFQPPHLSHLELFEAVLARHRRLVVAITNPDPWSRRPDPAHATRHEASSNPFTFHERLRLVEAALGGAGVARTRYDVVPFPLDEPGRWPHYVPPTAVHYLRVRSPWEARKADRLRAGGVRVVELAPDGGERSATDIRGALRAGRDDWRTQVPPAVAALVDELLGAQPLAER